MPYLTNCERYIYLFYIYAFSYYSENEGKSILFYFIIFFVLLVPPDNDVKVRKIEVVDFVPEQGNTTFSVKFSWIGPVFNVSHYGYFFKYELMGYTKHEIIINGNLVWNFKKVKFELKHSLIYSSARSNVYKGRGEQGRFKKIFFFTRWTLHINWNWFMKKNKVQTFFFRKFYGRQQTRQC